MKSDFIGQTCVVRTGSVVGAALLSPASIMAMRAGKTGRGSDTVLTSITPGGTLPPHP